jgi:hypothetical protein
MDHSRGYITTNKQKNTNINQVNRKYYLNLFSANAEKTTNADQTKNIFFKWNIRDLQLGSSASISLIQLIHTNAVNSTGYVFRLLESYADGYDSFNQTSAILYMGLGLNAPSLITEHKLISQNLNTITIQATDNTTSPIGITGVNIIDGGSGYTVGTFDLIFTGGGGTGATGKFIVSSVNMLNKVTTIDITNPGSGYTSAPTLSFTNSAVGSGANAIATIGYLTSNTNAGINTNITFSVVLEIIDYFDENQTY